MHEQRKLWGQPGGWQWQAGARGWSEARVYDRGLSHPSWGSARFVAPRIPLGWTRPQQQPPSAQRAAVQERVAAPSHRGRTRQGQVRHQAAPSLSGPCPGCVLLECLRANTSCLGARGWALMAPSLPLVPGSIISVAELLTSPASCRPQAKAWEGWPPGSGLPAPGCWEMTGGQKLLSAHSTMALSGHPGEGSVLSLCWELRGDGGAASWLQAWVEPNRARLAWWGERLGDAGEPRASPCPSSCRGLVGPAPPLHPDPKLLPRVEPWGRNPWLHHLVATLTTPHWLSLCPGPHRTSAWRSLMTRTCQRSQTTVVLA